MIVLCNWRLDGCLKDATCHMSIGNLVAFDLIATLIGALQIVSIGAHDEGWMRLVTLDNRLVIRIQLAIHNLISHGFNA